MACCDCECLLTCRICGAKVRFGPTCQCALGDHLLDKHPDIATNHYSGLPSRCCGAKPFKPNRFGNMKRQSAFPKSSSLYKTTVETWNCGPVTIKCPQCNAEDSPCIRKQRNKVAYTSLGALCLLGCWPLCFLPFLTSGGSTVQLYCKNCGKYLGEYNRKDGSLIEARGDEKALSMSDMCT